MTGRLIDADELHEIINWTHMKPPFSKKAVHRYIDMARTVDAEPVIRCKDCKYSVDEYDDGECYCDYEKDLRYIKDWDHYCSWAEGKEK